MILEVQDTEITAANAAALSNKLCQIANGAVYDDEIFAKVKMAVVCTLFIHELNVGTYLKSNRQFKLDDQIRICYQFSRELEHSDLNLNRFEELMSEKEIFSFENLLKIC